MSERVLVLSDLHCGHRAGITPPTYQAKLGGKRRQWNKFAQTQAELWDWYVKTIRSLGKLDMVIVNGDAIDGSGHRSGGTELIVRDRIEQAEMATEVISVARAPRYRFTYGTGYHTGDSEDMEDIIAANFDAKIGSHEFITVGGVVIDAKHHCAHSSMPYGDLHQLGKQILDNYQWASRGEQPEADVVLRSHVHKYTHCTVRIGTKVVQGVITPALQGYGSKYGARRCSRPVDIGMTVIDIHRGQAIIRPVFAQLPSMRAA